MVVQYACVMPEWTGAGGLEGAEKRGGLDERTEENPSAYCNVTL